MKFHRNVPVGEPYFISGSLPKDASGSSYTVTDSLRLTDSVALVLTLGDDTRRELKRQLEQPHTHDTLYSLYRFAIAQSDAVARFMFLYNLLLQLHDDKQKQVDDFIRGEAPTVPQSLSPKGVMETVFTRLRNEVGHSRAGITPEQTLREIADNVVGLQNLTRKAVTRAVTGNSP